MDITKKAENFKKPIGLEIYETVSIFVKKNKNILINNNNIVVYLLNRLGGFGSALLMHIQNSLFLKYINKNITIIPHFSENSDLFKYHEETCVNSFFLYFKNKKKLDITNKYIYFVRASEINEIPFYTYCMPITNNINNNYFIKYFNNNYELNIGDNIKEYISKIRILNIPLIGIHIRSLYQKKLEYNHYTIISLEQRIQKLSIILNKTYSNYVLFLATDVIEYIDLSKKYFKNVYFLDFINRIPNGETDSVPLLDKYKGFKLGSDILYDCLGLSLCDKIYLSGSNIPFIVSMLNPNINMDEY
jgi:hypothetical protein